MSAGSYSVYIYIYIKETCQGLCSSGDTDSRLM